MAKQKLRNPYVALLTKLHSGPHKKTNKALRQEQKRQTQKEINKLLD